MSKNVFPIEADSIGKTSDGTYAADMGVDINAPAGTPCVAIGDGQIVYSEWGHTSWTTPPDTPNSVKILLDEPVVIGDVAYRYAWYTHLSELARDISYRYNINHVKIAAGDPVGKTGLGNQVPHLHITLATDEGLDNYCPPFVLRDWLYGLINQFKGGVDVSDNILHAEKLGELPGNEVDAKAIQAAAVSPDGKYLYFLYNYGTGAGTGVLRVKIA